MAEQKISADTMGELSNLIRRACELAQNLKSNLPNFADQPSMLCISIDEIVNTLSAAKEKVLVSQMMSHEKKQPQFEATSMQENARTIDLLLMQQQLQADVGVNWSKMVGTVDFPPLLRSSGIINEVGGRDHLENSERTKVSEGEVQAIESSPSRPRKSGKKVDLEKRTKMIPAPEFGNTELPSDIDGFSWRKYGQKEILGSKYPRSYYRCTHQKLYECLAKKQVQRDSENPSMFQVTYRGIHTCHTSSTAPSSSSLLPQQLLLTLDMSHDNAQTSHLSPSPMNLTLHMGGQNHGNGTNSSGGTTSSSRYDGGDYPIMDLADAMFNFGRTSGNSMEALFPSSED